MTPVLIPIGATLGGTNRRFKSMFCEYVAYEGPFRFEEWCMPQWPIYELALEAKSQVSVVLSQPDTRPFGGDLMQLEVVVGLSISYF